MNFDPKTRTGVRETASIKMAFLHRRFFSTSVRNRQNLAHYQSIRPKLSTPSPTSMGAVLDSPELKQLAEKAKGSWKEFTKEEAVKRMYAKCKLYDF